MYVKKIETAGITRREAQRAITRAVKAGRRAPAYYVQALELLDAADREHRSVMDRLRAKARCR